MPFSRYICTNTFFTLTKCLRFKARYSMPQGKVKGIGVGSIMATISIQRSHITSKVEKRTVRCPYGLVRAQDRP